ncbi:hypothetical protein JHK82_052236 [Glycine max]|nr:hypothetical protein JHK85_052923 [Glycine max]KAG5082073.1 hypothetical protein JHK84_052111 [Glycine max]KAG5084839.1 hypothetical protein JHK82_052236 [Glycine max]
MDMEATTTMTRKNMDLAVSKASNAHHNAQGGVARPSTTSPACFSVRSVVGSAYVCHRGIMGTKQCALATTTGRPRKEDPNALNNLMLCSSSN